MITLMIGKNEFSGMSVLLIFNNSTAECQLTVLYAYVTCLFNLILSHVLFILDIMLNHI